MSYKLSITTHTIKYVSCVCVCVCVTVLNETNPTMHPKMLFVGFPGSLSLLCTHRGPPRPPFSLSMCMCVCVRFLIRHMPSSNPSLIYPVTVPHLGSQITMIHHVKLFCIIYLAIHSSFSQNLIYISNSLH